MKIVCTVLFFLLSPFFFGQINTPEKKEREEKLNNSIRRESETTAEPVVPAAQSKSVAQTESESLAAINAYFVARYNQYHRQPNRRTLTESEKNQLNEQLTKMMALESQNPYSLLAYYELGQHDVDRSEALLSAYQLEKKDSRTLQLLCFYFHQIGKVQEEIKALKSLHAQNVITQEELLYAQDVLQLPLPESAILTHGYEDFLAIRYVQLIKGIEPKRYVLNLDLMNSSHYRQSLKERGWVLPNNDFIDVRWVQQFCSNNEGRVYLAATLPKPYLEPIQQQLFVVGLTFYFGRTLPSSVDLLSVHRAMTYEQLKSGEKGWSRNYLPFLLILKKRYPEQSKEWDEKIDYIIRKEQLPAALKSK